MRYPFPVRWLLLLGILVGLILVGRSQPSEDDSQTPASDAAPAKVDPIAGSQFNRLKLSPRAAERLGIETVKIGNGKIVPYSAVIYGLHGETWVYVSPEPFVFVRTPIVIDRIDGDQAILSDGLEVGTQVVTVGVAELYGVDTGVGK